MGISEIDESSGRTPEFIKAPAILKFLVVSNNEALNLSNKYFGLICLNRTQATTYEGYTCLMQLQCTCPA